MFNTKREAKQYFSLQERARTLNNEIFDKTGGNACMFDDEPQVVEHIARSRAIEDAQSVAELKAIIAKMPHICSICDEAEGAKVVGRRIDYNHTTLDGRYKIAVFNGYACEACLQDFISHRLV